eukprot:365647-Chlamydomonas_euryale.AAC.14
MHVGPRRHCAQPSGSICCSTPAHVERTMTASPHAAAPKNAPNSSRCRADSAAPMSSRAVGSHTDRCSTPDDSHRAPPASGSTRSTSRASCTHEPAGSSRGAADGTTNVITNQSSHGGTAGGRPAGGSGGG